VVNLDGLHARETMVHWDLWALGLDELGLSPDSFQVIDLLDGSNYAWSKDTFVRLDPARPNGRVAHIALVKTK